MRNWGGGPGWKKANPQGLKPSDIAGLNVRAEARTLQAEARTLQTGPPNCYS